jgi:tetratricopeptide (TPR) repeat protein
VAAVPACHAIGVAIDAARRAYFFHHLLGRAVGRLAAAVGVAALAAAVSAAPPAAEEAARFTADAQAVLLNPTAAPERDVVGLLERGLQVGRPYVANLAAKGWLARQPAPGPDLLLAAARVAEQAGDLKTAASRYKLFIAAGPADSRRAAAVTRLLGLLVDDLGRTDDAYAFMARQWAELRPQPGVGPFDLWFLEQAQARRDWPAAAAILVTILEQGVPLEFERLAVWQRLDWLMGELARGTPEQFPALVAARRLPGLVRESPARAARYAFIVAWLDHRAGTAGRPPEAQEESFRGVLAAADGYLAAAPVAATLADVLNVLRCGGNDTEAWLKHGPAIHGWWAKAFGMLPADEQGRAIDWEGPWELRGSPQSLAAVAGQFPQVFAAARGTRTMPVVLDAKEPTAFASQATYLRGVPSPNAKAINAIAATQGKDLLAGLRHLSERESWHGGFESTFRAAERQVVPAWEACGGQPAGAGTQALLAWAPEAVLGSPVALFDPAAAGRCLALAFAAGGGDPDDKSGFAAWLRAVDWVPWDEPTRSSVVGPVHEAFKKWANRVRQAAAGPDKAKWERAAAAIAPLEEEFRKALDPAVSEAGVVAPDPLAGHLAACVRALRAKQPADFLTAARAAYALVRDYAAKQTPYGQATLAWLVTHRPDAFDTLEFQREVIADQLGAWTPQRPSAALEVIDAAVTRPNWSAFRVPLADRDAALALAATIGAGIVTHVDQGFVDRDIFARFLWLREGPGWQERDSGGDVLAKLIDTRVCLKPGNRVGGMPSATADYQDLVVNRFPKMADRYPPASYFDDMFVEEFRGRGWLDWQFMEFSRRDARKKAANAAAALFSTFPTLATGPGNPLGYDTLPRALVAGSRTEPAALPPSWSPEACWLWLNHALQAEQPARGAFVAAAEAAWGKTRFDPVAMGRASIPADSAVMKDAAGRAEFFTRLAAFLDRGLSVPGRVEMPFLGPLGQLPGNAVSDAELAVLLAPFSGRGRVAWLPGMGHSDLGVLVADGLRSRQRFAELVGIAPGLWRIARDTRDSNLSRRLAEIAVALGKAGLPDAAAAFADAGVEVVGAALPEEVRTLLTPLRTEVMLAFGGTNPVPRSDPRWPIYDGQAAFTAGKLQTAWDRYQSAAAVAEKMHKELEPAFTTWLIRENTQTGNFERAQRLGDLMLAWIDATPGAVDAEAQAALLVAFADIALARRDYPQARALYERIAAAAEFDGTPGKRDAEIRVAEVDRLTRQYERAGQLLERLARRPDPVLQAEAVYQLALLKNDQDETEEAAAFLERLFSLAPNHVGGRILEGRINLQRRRYDVASKVRLGVLGDKKYLIPGKPLEVDLEDRNLSVVGKATRIEIRVWTAGGDEERFDLLPFGDSKTRFAGQIPTALAAVVKGDGTLQVAGGDMVQYAFGESFAGRDRLAAEPAAMRVTTDPELVASSGAILSPAEQEARELERLIRQKLRLADGQAETTLSAERPENQIKPGNPVNVRVVDPDRSTTGRPDTIEIRAATASGDALTVALTETGDYTGVFEGTVPTTSSQPTAFATDATDGNDPNYAIAPERGTPWVALADNVRPKHFSVDLNDNVALGRLEVAAGVPGRRLKDVLVQTSLNGRDFRTVGHWRADGRASFVPWDGAPRMEIVRFPGNRRQFTRLEEFEPFLATGRLTDGAPLVSKRLPNLAVGPLDPGLGGLAAPAGLDGTTDWFVGHWCAGFVAERPEVRTLVLDTRGLTKNMHAVLTIDGVPAGLRDDGMLAVTRPLAKGPHRIDVYVSGNRREPLRFTVLTESPAAPQAVPLADDLLDPARHPALADAFAVPAAKITGGDAGGFAVDFAPGTRGRVVRLLIADYETDAPAIEHVTLVDADGKRVLPTARSFLELAQNEVLEIIPGDRITIAYDDPTAVTPAAASQERFLTATFADAVVSAAFVNFREAGGENRAEYVPMRRFSPGDTVKVFIKDPDMDTSAEADRVSFTATAGRGRPVTLEALETAPHSGIFLGTVFPVAAEPQRPAEVAVTAGEDLTLGYIDRENTNPGIPWERSVIVEQVGTDEPQLRIFDVAARPLSADELARAERARPPVRRFEEVVPLTRELVAVRPETPTPAEPPTRALVEAPLLVEVLAPGLAKSPQSRVELFVQSESGRAKLGRPVAAGEFPLDVPGTIKLVARPSEPAVPPAPPGVSRVLVQGDRYATDPVTDGRFSFLVAKELGPVPEKSLVDEPPASGSQPVLAIRGVDRVHLGLRWTDAAGAERWGVRTVELGSEPQFDLMDRRYQEVIEGVHVGDSIHLRLIDPCLDTTDAKDVVTVRLAVSGGGGRDLDLVETLGHSGVFKGVLAVAFRDPGAAAAAATDATIQAAYGEEITVTHAGPGGRPLERKVTVFKGSDAEVVPFTKQFKDPEIAVQTQFTVAEAWFELAKRHRDLGQESLARREIAQGKKLLEEAIRDFPATESRAQADYLLANLAFEFAKDAANDEIALQQSLEAVRRFADLVATYPESEYAPKSQYKKALVLEKMGRIDEACEEYVKLSYRYPDNELVAETIARLGQYFLAKGKEFDARAEGQPDPVAKEKVVLQGRDMFRTAAQVFGRLGERFPGHELAGKTRMLSAQCFLRAGELAAALAGFRTIAGDPKADKDLAAEAMYWAGDVSLKLGDAKAAYRSFKKLTWDYPESKWAKFARGRLTEGAMVMAARTEDE